MQGSGGSREALGRNDPHEVHRCTLFRLTSSYAAQVANPLTNTHPSFLNGVHRFTRPRQMGWPEFFYPYGIMGSIRFQDKHHLRGLGGASSAFIRIFWRRSSKIISSSAFS